MPVNLTGVSREWLVSDNPVYRLGNANVEYLTATQPAQNPLLLLQTSREFLYRPLDMVFMHESKEVLIQLTSVPTIMAQVPQTLLRAIQHRDEQTLANIISFEYAAQTVTQVTQKSPDMPFVWSSDLVAQQTVQVTQALPVVTALSYENVSQAQLLAVGRYGYATPDEVMSLISALQTVMLVCISYDRPYVPQSGLYAPQQRIQVVQATPGMAIWRSPAIVPQQRVRVVQKRTREAFPISAVRVPQMRSQAVQRMTSDEMPVSPMQAGQSASQVVQQVDMPEPHGIDIAAQEQLLVAQQTVMPQAIGFILAAQEKVTVAQARPLTLPVSPDIAAQQRIQATQQADYQAPGEMLARVRVPQNVSQVLQSAIYPGADVHSMTRLAQSALVFSLQADANWYPPPNVVYQSSRNAFVPQYVELVPQAIGGGQPISVSVYSQMDVLTASHVDMPTPAQMARSGLFSPHLSQQIGYSVSYQSTGVPASDADVLKINQYVVTKATYPDAFLPTNYVVIPQINEQIAHKTVYDAAESLHLPVSVAYVSKQLTLLSGFPSPDTLHTPISALHITGQLSVSATYPSKDSVLSYALITQLAQQTAVTSRYPDKNVPQATERVSQVRQHIVTRDTSMYQLPVTPRRHRVRIFCRLVYD